MSKNRFVSLFSRLTFFVAIGVEGWGLVTDFGSCPVQTMQKAAAVTIPLLFMFLSGVLIIEIEKRDAIFSRNFNPEFQSFLEAIPNVNFAIFQSFPELGISSVEDLAAEDAAELGSILEILPSDVQTWINLARTRLKLPHAKGRIPSNREERAATSISEMDPENISPASLQRLRSYPELEPSG